MMYYQVLSGDGVESSQTVFISTDKKLASSVMDRFAKAENLYTENLNTEDNWNWPVIPTMTKVSETLWQSKDGEFVELRTLSEEETLKAIEEKEKQVELERLELAQKPKE